MKPNFLKNLTIFFSILAIAALACSGGASPAVQPVEAPVTDIPTNDASLSSSNRQRLISATVQIFGLYNEGGSLVPGYVGSGTILSPSGLILTNAHVASPASQGDPANEPDALGIAIVVQEDKPAVPSYIAEILAVDGFLDLAVLQIISSVDGTNVSPSSLNLPYVELGNSDSVHVGDGLNIFGFPAIGGNTITFTKGTVSGFSSEEQIGDRAWIKTDTTISGGNSGGLAADNNGRIIGVPTIAAASRDSETSDCRIVQDTNGDGVIDRNDSCVPIGGFLNGIRPVNLALPLVEAAKAGKQYVSSFAQDGVATESGSGNERATDFVWLDTSSTSSSQSCDFTDDVVKSYSTSALCIATAFEYSGMTNGQLLVEHWFLDGEKVAEYSYVWEWDASGLLGTYLPTNNDNLMPAGSYTVELFAGDALTRMGTSPAVKVESDGSTQPPTQPSGDTVTVYGQVYDNSTNKPIADAHVFILTPGMTYEQWGKENYADKYVVAYVKTGSDGTYKVTGIPRNTEFTLVFSAQGYYDAYLDNAIAVDSDPAQFELNVGLTK